MPRLNCSVKTKLRWLYLLAFLGLAGPAGAAPQYIHARLPEVVASERPISRVPASNRLDLVFGLPLRHRPELTNFLRQIYQRGSPAYHHYLKPAEFAANYGPTVRDYQSLINFAKSHGLTVTGTHPNRTLLTVNGAAGDIEKALHVHLNYYRHPTGNRSFYAPDAAPSIDLDTPVLAVSGLHNYTLPHPCLSVMPGGAAGPLPSVNGSGPGGNYVGGDFRAAYAPGVSLTGVGQSVGLFELDGYLPGDITNYEALAGETNAPPLEEYFD